MLMSPDQKSLSLQWMMVNAETHGSPRCWEEATAVGSTLNKAFVPSALRLKKHCPVKSWKMGWTAVKYHPLDFTQPLQPLTPNNCDHLQWSAQDWPFQPSVMEGREASQALLMNYGLLIGSGRGRIIEYHSAEDLHWAPRDSFISVGSQRALVKLSGL